MVNLSTLRSGRRSLDILFIISVFKKKLICSSILDTVDLPIATRLIRDCPIFNVLHRVKIPLARYIAVGIPIYVTKDTFR
jgi:hypothetical protein